jgi:hypothetical protein
MNPQELKSRFPVLQPNSATAISETFNRYEVFKTLVKSEEVAAQLTPAAALLKPEVSA